MKDMLRILSAVGVFLAGIAVLILWIIAAHDRSELKDSGFYKCLGCIYLYHDSITGGGDLNQWLRDNRDAYPILIAFGVICGVFWMVTGVIGLMGNSAGVLKAYFFSGIITYLIFAVIFPIIVERLTWVNANCGLLPIVCKTNQDWRLKHFFDSGEQFWGAALAGFILGAFQLGAAAYNFLAPPAPVSAWPSGQRMGRRRRERQGEGRGRRLPRASRRRRRRQRQRRWCRCSRCS